MSRPSRRRTVGRGAAVLLVLGLLTFLLVRTGGEESGWTADLEHASGLQTGDEVRVAGIPVGSVSAIELHGAVAEVRFDLDPGVRLTDESRAAVKLATLLGRTYLDVTPGHGAPATDRTIPTSRTTPAYTVSTVVTETGRTAEALDLETLDAAVDAGAKVLDEVDPDTMASALDGTTRLARVASGQDAALRRLFDLVSQVTATVAGQSERIGGLVDDAAVVSRLVVERRDTLADLVTTGRRAIDDLDDLATTNRSDLTSVLGQLDDVLAVVQDNSAALDTSMQRLPAMSRYFANATGNGPWIDVFSPYFLLPDALVCVLDPGACS
jgi:phospholipid/cholesterol/gamma-HCH transport system substrate-binding protein